MFGIYDEKGKPIRRARPVIDCQTAVENGEEVRTEQAHKAEVDINQIVKRHAGREDLLMNTSQIMNLQFDDNPTNDFQEMMNMVIQGQQAFEQLPLEIKRKFGYNPAEYMDYVRNPDNRYQLIQWGMIEPAPEPEPPVQVEVVNQTITETPPEAT